MEAVIRRRIRNYSLLLVLLALVPMLLVEGCNPDNPVTPPLSVGEMQATVSSEAFFDATDAAVSTSNGVYSVFGTMTSGSAKYTVEVNVPIKTIIPYTVDVAGDPNAQLGYFSNPTGSGGKQYVAQFGFGSGTITITQISPTLMGTFSGIVWQQSPTGSDTTRTISGGQFNASF